MGPRIIVKEDKLKTRDFAPQFSVKRMPKDMRLAEAAGGIRSPLRVTVRECLARVARAEAQGMGHDNFSSLIRLLGNGV